MPEIAKVFCDGIPRNLSRSFSDKSLRLQICDQKLLAVAIAIASCTQVHALLSDCGDGGGGDGRVGGH